jgi:hypothetical protein
VIDAASSDEVVTVFESGSAHVSVVLSDAELTGTFNAFALRLWVQQHWPATEFVLVGNVIAAARACGEICDKGPHLKRPYDPQAVVAHIRRLLSSARK